MSIPVKANGTSMNLAELLDIKISLVNIESLRVVAQPGEQYIDFNFEDSSSVRWDLSSTNGLTLLSKPAGGSWKTEKRINWS